MRLSWCKNFPTQQVECWNSTVELVRRPPWASDPGASRSRRSPGASPHVASTSRVLPGCEKTRRRASQSDLSLWTKREWSRSQTLHSDATTTKTTTLKSRCRIKNKNPRVWTNRVNNQAVLASRHWLYSTQVRLLGPTRKQGDEHKSKLVREGLSEGMCRQFRASGLSKQFLCTRLRVDVLTIQFWDTRVGQWQVLRGEIKQSQQNNSSGAPGCWTNCFRVATEILGVMQEKAKRVPRDTGRGVGRGGARKWGALVSPRRENAHPGTKGPQVVPTNLFRINEKEWPAHSAPSSVRN